MGFFGGSSVDLTSPGPIGSTTPNTGRFTTLTLAPSANTTPLTASGYSLTGTNAQSFFDLSGTWNTTGTPTAFKLNVTDTASNASSLLMDLQVGGVSKYGFKKNVSFGGNAGDLLVWGFQSDAIKIGTYYNSSAIGLGTAANNNFFVFGTNGSYVSIGHVNGFEINTSTGAVRFYAEAANIIAQRNSTNAQTFRLYRTYTDASNYERLGFLTTNTTRYTITSQNAGTGSARSLEVSFYTSASDPTSTDITSGCFSVWKNSGTGTIKLWANDGGTMKSVSLA